MSHIHTDDEDIRKLYVCIDDQITYIHKLLNEETMTSFQLELALKALERREHALHMRLDPLRKLNPNLSLIPKDLCKHILEEIFQIERDSTMRMKVTNALKQNSAFFACLERLKVEMTAEAMRTNKVLTKEPPSHRIEKSGDATDPHKQDA